MNLQSIRRQDIPLHAEVAAVLRHQIKSGELEHGTKLPALRELSETLGVARMTVIQAMNTLEEEGLIERYSGRGTFVREISTAKRHTLHMQADISQIYAMVSQLKVDVRGNDVVETVSRIGEQEYRLITRTHLKDGNPFCHVKLQLDSGVYAKAPDRFSSEIAVTVLKDLGISLTSAKQKITISYADFDLAESLGVTVNSAVFRVTRAFFDAEERLVYSALLIYPADLLEMEIDFALSDTEMAK